MKKNTVNVLEIVDGNPISLRAFNDTVKGNKEAERLFEVVIMVNGGTKDEIESCIENGCFSQDDYSAFLMHSN